MTTHDLARRVGLTPRQLTYWRKKGYVHPPHKQGRAWVYDLRTIKTLLLVRHLLEQHATPQCVLAAVRTLEEDAKRLLGTDFWNLKVYVLGSEVFAENGKLLMSVRTRSLAHPVLLKGLLLEADAVHRETGPAQRAAPLRSRRRPRSLSTRSAPG